LHERGGRLERPCHFPATGLLGARQHGVEQRTAGVGVDLDELRALLAKMEIKGSVRVK